MSSPIDTKEATAVLECPKEDTYGILLRANAVRIERRGFEVHLCGVVNAKSGFCSEDCKFCAQSEHNDSNIECYPLIDDDKILESARIAQQTLAGRFGIVTSGVAVDHGQVSKRRRASCN